MQGAAVGGSAVVGMEPFGTTAGLGIAIVAAGVRVVAAEAAWETARDGLALSRSSSSSCGSRACGLAAVARVCSCAGAGGGGEDVRAGRGSSWERLAVGFVVLGVVVAFALVAGGYLSVAVVAECLVEVVVLVAVGQLPSLAELE